MTYDPLEDVTLHTGETVIYAAAQATYMLLLQLATSRPMAVADLADWLADPAHQIAEETRRELPRQWTFDASMSKATIACIRACIVGPDAVRGVNIVHPVTGLPQRRPATAGDVEI